MKADLLDGVGAVLGEGPAWDARTGELVSVDIQSGTVHLHDVDGQRLATYELGGHVSSALPADEGGWLITTPDGFVFLERDGSLRSLLAVEADRPDLRFNDAKCDPWGRAVAGTMRYDEAPGSASLYRLEAAPTEGPDHQCRLTARVLLAHLGLANGLGWSSDGMTMYFVDSLARTVTSYAYGPDEPRLGRRQELVAFDARGPKPDGMCVDVEGCLWVALYGGGAVHRFGPDGLLDTVVSLPVPRPTSVAFGGPDGDRLFITTAGGAGGDQASGAGGLWAVDPGVAGPPATLWRHPSPTTSAQGPPHG